jgi:hypothetical protein
MDSTLKLERSYDKLKARGESQGSFQGVCMDLPLSDEQMPAMLGAKT